MYSPFLSFAAFQQSMELCWIFQKKPVNLKLRQVLPSQQHISLLLLCITKSTAKVFQEQKNLTVPQFCSHSIYKSLSPVSHITRLPISVIADQQRQLLPILQILNCNVSRGERTGLQHLRQALNPNDWFCNDRGFYRATVSLGKFKLHSLEKQKYNSKEQQRVKPRNHYSCRLSSLEKFPFIQSLCQLRKPVWHGKY